MADVKNYLVNYIVNSEGNAANFFQSLVAQAEKAQAAIIAARDNILKISSGMGQALGNVKDAWNITPTVDISKAMTSLKELEAKTKEASARMRRDIATAMNGVQGGSTGFKGGNKDIEQARKFLAARNSQQLKLQEELLKLLPSQQANKITKAVDQLWGKEDISSKVLTRIGKLPDAKAKLRTLREYIDESAKLKSEINAQAAKAQQTLAPATPAQNAARQGFEAHNIAALNELEKRLQETNKLYGESKAKYENLVAGRKRAMYQYGMESKGFYPTWKKVFNEPEKAATLPKFLSNYVSDAHKNDAALASSKSTMESYGKQVKTLEEQIANTKKLSGSTPVTLAVSLNTAPAIEMANELIRTISTRSITIPVTIGILGEKPNSLAYKDSIDKITGKATEAGKEMANKTNQLIEKQKTQTQKGAKAEIPGVVNQISNSVKSINNLLKEQPVSFIGKFDGGAVMQQLEATLAKLKAYAQANPIPLFGEMSKAAPSSKGGKAVSKGKTSVSGTAEGSVEGVRAKLQSQANEKPITFRSAFNGGDAAFQANLSRQRIQQLVNEKPITFRSAFNGGDAAFQANLSLARLQRLVGEKPIIISSEIKAANLSSAVSKAIQKAKVKGVEIPVKVKSSNVASNINKIVQKAKSKGIEISVKVKTTGVKASINKAITQAKQASNVGKGLTIPVKFSSSGVTAKFKTLLKNLQTQANKNPIKVKAQFENGNIINAFNQSIADLNKSIKQLAKMRKEGFVNAGGKSGTSERMSGVVGGGSSRSSYARSLGLLPTADDRIYRRPTQDMYTRARSFFYPLTGNTSFGARTPAMVDMAKGMGTMFAVGGAMSAVGSSLSQAVEYQNTMKTVEAILRTSDKNFTTSLFGNMSRNVRNVGKETKFTAPQVADAARFMAMAGLSTRDINNSIRPVADIALIGDTDLGTTADKLTNVMTTFGLKSEQMREIADIMTSTFTRSNTDMMMLAESAKYAGGIAHLYGGKDFMKTFSDTMAMFGILGNAGIQASSAGTTIRMMYQNLMQPNKKQLEALNKYGIFTRDTKGHPLQMGDIITQMAQKIPRDKMADAIGQMFRITAQPGAATLASHVGQLSELMAANRAAEGSNISGQIANEKKNTLSGLWAQVTSTFTEGVVQAMENRQGGWEGMLKQLRNYLADPKTVEMISNIIDLVEMMAKTMASFAKIWAGAYHMFPNLINGWLKMQLLMTQVGYLFTPIVQIIGAITMFKNSILGLTGSLSSATIAATRASVANHSMGVGSAVSGVAAGSAVGKRYAAKRFGYGGILYGSAAMDEAYQAAKYRKWQYELKRSDLRNTVTYHGQRTVISPLWQGATMAQFGSNPAEVNQWMKERSMFASIPMKARQDAAKHADELIARQQAIMNEQLRAMRRPEQLASNALMMRYAAMYGGRKGANVNWVNRGIRIREANAAALAARRPGQIVNQELMKRFYMSGGKGGFGLGMKGAFRRGVEMGTIGLSSAGLIGGIKSTFYSLMAGLSKAIGLLVSPVGLAIAGIAAMTAGVVLLNKTFEKQKQQRKNFANISKQTSDKYAQQRQKIIDDADKAQKNIKRVHVNLSSGVKLMRKYPKQKNYFNENNVVSTLTNAEASDALTPSEISSSVLGNYIVAPEVQRALNATKRPYYATNSKDVALTYGYVPETLANTTSMNKADEKAKELGVIAQWANIAAQQPEIIKAVKEMRTAVAKGDKGKQEELLRNFAPDKLNAVHMTGSSMSAWQLSKIQDPSKYYEWQYAQYKYLQEAQMRASQALNYNRAMSMVNNYDKLSSKQRSAYDATELARQLLQGIPLVINNTPAALSLTKMGTIDWATLANTVNNGVPFTLQQQQEILANTYSAILDDPNIKNVSGIGELLKVYLPKIAEARSPYDDFDFGYLNMGTYASRQGHFDTSKEKKKNKITIPYKAKPYSIPLYHFNLGGVSWTGGSQFNKDAKKYGPTKATQMSSERKGNSPAPKKNTGISTNNRVVNRSLRHSTTGTVSSPAVTNKTNKPSSQKEYASSYDRNAARPTQVNITIENLCRFDKTSINKDADSNAIAMAVENKISEAIAMLSASALNSAGAVIAQGLA